MAAVATALPRTWPTDGGSPSLVVLTDAQHPKGRLVWGIETTPPKVAPAFQVDFVDAVTGEWLEGVGARRVDIGQGPDVTWVVFADPEGNEFCLLRRTVQEVMAERT